MSGSSPSTSQAAGPAGSGAPPRLSALIVARNEAVEARAALVNESPYDDGWVVRVKPQAGATAIAALLAIDAAVEGFKAYMAEHGVEGCGSCPEPEAEAS